jgi:hypothetical protein
MLSSILAGRLSKWLIYHKMLTKFQAGFVKGNRTADSIFLSKTTVHRYLRNKTGYVYWCSLGLENVFIQLIGNTYGIRQGRKELVSTWWNA